MEPRLGGATLRDCEDGNACGAARNASTDAGADEYIDVDPGEWDALMAEIDRGMSRVQEVYTGMGSGGGHSVPLVEKILSSNKVMRRWTGFDKRGLALIRASFSEQWEGMERAEIARRKESRAARAGKRGPRPMADVAADRSNNIPLVRSDAARRSAPGNRCRLDPFHILILALVRKYCNETEGRLGDLFDIDQSTVSRCLTLADRILGKMLPTPEKIMKLARDVDTPGAFAGLFPKGAGEAVVIFDGTHVRFARPLKAADRDPMISYKKKYPSGNTVIMVSADGMILGASRTYNGRVHDMAITRDFLEDMGRFGRMLRGGLTDAGNGRQAARPTIVQDIAPAMAEGAIAASGTAESDVVSATPAGQDAAGQDAAGQDAAGQARTSTDENQIREKHSEFVAKKIEIKIVQGLAALGAIKKSEQKLAALDAARRLEAMHDLEILLGNPPEDKTRVMGDSGFQGLGQDMPEAEVITPFKNSKNLHITPEQKKYNHELSKRRIKVENSICAVKHFRRVSEIYSGSLEEFNCEFNIACGLANLRYMLRNNTYGHWAQRLDLPMHRKKR